MMIIILMFVFIGLRAVQERHAYDRSADAGPHCDSGWTD